MPNILFYFFALLMIGGGIAVICFRNPVASALSMVASFVGLAALFIGLDSFFTGIIQILVYAGAIMVLFLFIIMLLDLKDEVKRAPKIGPVVAGLLLVLLFVFQLVGVISAQPDRQAPALQLQSAAASFPADSKIATTLASGKLPDVHLIGHTLFTQYNFLLQIIGVLLLVATVGVIALSKRQSN